MSAICLPNASTWLQRRAARLAGQDAEHWEEAEGDHDDDRRHPVQGPDHRDQGDRHRGGQDEVGETAADVGVEGVDATAGEGRHVAPTHPAAATGGPM
jgi:hypothetical protein